MTAGLQSAQLAVASLCALKLPKIRRKKKGKTCLVRSSRLACKTVVVVVYPVGAFPLSGDERDSPLVLPARIKPWCKCGTICRGSAQVQHLSTCTS